MFVVKCQLQFSLSEASSSSIAFKNNGMQLSLHDIKPRLERVVRRGGNTDISMHYNRVGRGVGDSCSLGAYLAKKGKKTVSITPTIASM